MARSTPSSDATARSGDGRWSAAGEAVSFTPGEGLLGCEAAFPVLHGPGGEDGSVQGLLEVLAIPYAGSDVESSAICMDKLVFKNLLARHGVPQVDFCRAGEEGWREIAAGFGRPVWVIAPVEAKIVTCEPGGTSLPAPGL